MIRPHLRRRIPGRTACATRNIDLRLTAKTSSQSGSVISDRVRGGPIPALLTRMSMPPNPFSTAVTKRATSADFETSAWIARARRPARSISRQAAWASPSQY